MVWKVETFGEKDKHKRRRTQRKCLNEVMCCTKAGREREREKERERERASEREKRDGWSTEILWERETETERAKRRQAQTPCMHARLLRFRSMRWMNIGHFKQQIRACKVQTTVYMHIVLLKDVYTQQSGPTQLWEMRE